MFVDVLYTYYAVEMSMHLLSVGRHETSFVIKKMISVETFKNALSFFLGWPLCFLGTVSLEAEVKLLNNMLKQKESIIWT